MSSIKGGKKFSNNNNVIPANAGIQNFARGSADNTHIAADAAVCLDSRIRGNDDIAK